MVRKIRLVFGACYVPAARHDPGRKLHLIHVYELLAERGYTFHGKCMPIVAPH